MAESELDKLYDSKGYVNFLTNSFLLPLSAETNPELLKGVFHYLKYKTLFKDFSAEESIDLFRKDSATGNAIAEKMRSGYGASNGFLEFLKSYLCNRELDTKNQYVYQARCYFSDEPLSRTFSHQKIKNFDIIRYDINHDRNALEKFFRPKKQTTEPVTLSEFSSSFKLGDGKLGFYEYLHTKLESDSATQQSLIKMKTNIQVGIHFSVS